MKFLGDIVSVSGVSIDLEKVEAVMSWERPKSVSGYIVSWDWQGIIGGSLRTSLD